MIKRERSIREYFASWLTKNPTCLPEIFTENIIYSESWGPEYIGLEKIQYWFDEWTRRASVTRWDITKFIHQDHMTAVEWHFCCAFDNGKIEEFDGVSLIEFSKDDKIVELKEFASTYPHFDPYSGKDCAPVGYSIQPALPEHIPFLNAIELAAATIFPPGSIPEHILSERVPISLLTEAAQSGTLWVALDVGGFPVGYGLLRFIDGLALLAQLDVHPDHGRKGIGKAIIARIIDHARLSGAGALYLTTFSHVPWNAPFYVRLGFEALAQAELPSLMKEILAEEYERGLQQRIAMRLSLHR